MATLDITDMLISLQSSLGPLYKLATASAYIIGCSLLVKAIYSLKIYGEARTMMASNTNIREPMFNLVLAVFLIYLPTGFQILMNSTFGYGNVMAYDQFPSTSGLAPSQAGQVLLQLTQVVGVYAFVKGFVMLSRSAGQGAQPQQFGKGLTHVVGGIFAMNIVGTFDVIANTFNITF